MLSKFRYYTGIIFQAYTYGTGEPLIKGGRYNELMKHFGKPASSIGFAIVVDNLMLALSRQKLTVPAGDKTIVITYDPGNLEKRRFRKQWRFEIKVKKVGIVPGKGGAGLMRYLTFALTKGRLASKTLDMFEKIGITCEEMRDKDSRKLIFTNEELKLKFFLAKGPDVPTYVEYGAADIGIVGKDTILEEGRKLYEVMDLGFGACRMCVCGLKAPEKS